MIRPRGNSSIAPTIVYCGAFLIAAFDVAIAQQNKPAEKKPPRPKLEQTEIYDRVLKGTAWVRAMGDNNGTPFEEWYGTAWVYDAKRGLLVTNEHVVHDHDEVELFFPVTADDELQIDPNYYRQNVTPTKATVIDRDSRLDLALVQVDKLPPGARALPLAARSPKPGERLHSVAGLPRASEGLWIYSTGETRQVYRRTNALGQFTRMVESQMPTNKGNSGGAIVNDWGEVVAVCEGMSTDPIVYLLTMFVDLSEVQAYLEEVVPLVDPQDADTWYARGHRRHGELRYDQAAADYNQALKLNPKMPAALMNRGWVFYEQGDHQTALADFEAAIKIDPEMAPAYQGRGLARRELGRLDEALADLTEAIRRDPDSAELYQQRANTYARLEQNEQELADRNRAVERNPKSAQFLVERGQTLRKLGRAEESLQDFCSGFNLEPSNAMYCYEWGMGLYDAGKYDAAVVAYDLAIQRDNTSPETFNNRAFALRELGRLQEASQSFAEAARLAPESAKYFVRWGMVLVEGKQHQDAVKILSKAIELDPRYRRAYELRAEAYEALGESNLAAADERRAAALESD